MSDAVDRIDRMIVDLLDASRLEAGEHFTLKFDRCDVKQVSRDACDELSTRHGDRFLVSAEGPTQGNWNADGLRRVLDNLLSNAVKYGEPRSPILVTIKRVEDRTMIAVHNYGTIIAIEEQSNLFQPFHRTSLAQASNTRGWGLGLTLVKGIVEAHQGIVKVESYLKEGTTFTVDLPNDSQRADPLPQPAET